MRRCAPEWTPDALRDPACTKAAKNVPKLARICGPAAGGRTSGRVHIGTLSKGAVARTIQGSTREFQLIGSSVQVECSPSPCQQTGEDPRETHDGQRALQRVLVNSVNSVAPIFDAVVTLENKQKARQRAAARCREAREAAST